MPNSEETQDHRGDPRLVHMVVLAASLTVTGICFGISRAISTWLRSFLRHACSISGGLASPHWS